MLFYLVNLILLNQFNVANSLIKKHYLTMKKCNQVFKANVRRFQALSLRRMYESENQKKKTKITQNEKYIRKNKIERILKRAEKHFNRAECAWGLGLTYYQQAMMKIHHIDQH